MNSSNTPVELITGGELPVGAWTVEEIEECKRAFFEAFNDEPTPIKVSTDNLYTHKTICYISGPMSGLLDLNYPAFFEAEEKLKYYFDVVLNPARNTLDPGQQNTWANWMRKALKMMLSEHTTHIVLLPGWETSRGARAEVYVATLLDIKVFNYTDF